MWRRETSSTGADFTVEIVDEWTLSTSLLEILVI